MFLEVIVVSTRQLHLGSAYPLKSLALENGSWEKTKLVKESKSSDETSIVGKVQRLNSPHQDLPCSENKRELHPFKRLPSLLAARILDTRPLRVMSTVELGNARIGAKWTIAL